APFPEAECFSCADNQGPAQGYRNAVERGAEICTGHGNDGGGIETQSGAKESDLQSGEITRIACDEIGQLMSAQVHGAAYGDAQMLMAMTAAVLEGAGQARTDDCDAHCWDQLSNSCAVMGRNWTVSPGETRVAGTRAG